MTISRTPSSSIAVDDLVHHQTLAFLQVPVLPGDLVERQHRVVARGCSA